MKAFLRLALLLTAVTTVAGPAPAAGSGKPVRDRPGPVPRLVDAQSPLLAYGQPLALGKSRTIGGHALTFTRDSRKRLVLTRQLPGRGSPRKERIDSLPTLVRFGAFDAEYAVAVRPGPDEDTVELAAGWGIRLADGWLLDADFDGRPGTKGDVFVAKESRTVAPFTGEIWQEDAAWLARRREEGGFELAPLAMPHPENSDHSRAFRLMQWRRQQCGLLPVRYDKSMEPGMRAHADYCVDNKYRGHEQERGKRGWSEAGARAGLECVFGFGKTSVVAGMHEQLATLYHRDGILDPALTATAIVLHRGVFGVNIRKAISGKYRNHALVYPPHGMENVPANFNRAGEIPMPVPGLLPVGNGLGTAIGIYSFSLQYVENLARPPTFVVTPLDRKGRAGPPVEGHLYWPGHHPGTGTAKSNNGEVSFTPSGPLSPGTLYRCRVDTDLPTVKIAGGGKAFVYEWEFRVGR